MRLSLCNACSRHVHADEFTCPFCRGPLVIIPHAPQRRVSRAATIIGIGVATACGGAVDPGPSDASHDDVHLSYDAGYGTPPFDAHAADAPTDVEHDSIDDAD